MLRLVGRLQVSKIAIPDEFTVCLDQKLTLRHIISIDIFKIIEL